MRKSVVGQAPGNFVISQVEFKRPIDNVTAGPRRRSSATVDDHAELADFHDIGSELRFDQQAVDIKMPISEIRHTQRRLQIAAADIVHVDVEGD